MGGDTGTSNMEGDTATPNVLYAEGDQDLRAETDATFGADPRLEVQAVESVDAVTDVLADDVLDCVVTGARLADGDWSDVVETVRSHDPDLPLVLYSPERNPELASQATAAGVTEYLPRPADDGSTLSERVRAAVDEFDRIRELRTQSNRYEQLMETLPLSMYFKDEQARFVDVSDKMRRDLDADDPIGKTDADLFGDPEDPTGKETLQDDFRVIQTGEAIVGKEERHRVQEGEIWVRSSKFPLYDENGEIAGLMGTSRNVTGQKSREEELRRKSQRLEQFASFVSHDLRNPVNVAQGYLDHAIETGDEAALDEVEESLDRMETLIGDLLTTVQQSDDTTAEWIDFPAFLDRVWTGTDVQSGALVVDVPEDTRIAAVGGQFRQLLSNLFRNADEHGGEGVAVTVGTLDDGFYLEDDGPGIDPEVRDAVFDYGHSEGGTGIGLTIAREIAASHGWDVTLTEGTEGGARFEFRDCLLHQATSASVREGVAVPIDEQADVGDPSVRGHVERRDGGRTWSVTGGGENVWADVEEHFFAHGTVGGDVRITARVTDLQDTEEYSKAGVMVRDWPGENSSFAYVGATPAHGPETIHRTFSDQEIEAVQFEELDGVPRWYRLEWIDNTVTLQTSADGAEWTTLDRRAVPGRDPLSVGLAVCSTDSDRAVRALFEDVRIVQLHPSEEAE